MRAFKNDILAAAAEQVAFDLACTAQDFLQDENTVVSALMVGSRRNFQEQKDFFHIATFGNGAVISADPKIYPFAKALSLELPGIEIFDAKGVYIINKELEKHGKALACFHQYYLPQTPYLPIERTDLRFQLFEEDEVPMLYSEKGFPNALVGSSVEARHDVLAVVAKNGDHIIGIAGASSDSERFWQLGIDVHHDFKQSGIASALVSRLAKEVLMRGRIPYYGTWWSNIASRSVAHRCNFYPAWVEMTAIDIK